MITTDHPGLFGRDSVTWRVHSDPMFGVAGLRALQLQALHPRAMAAVAQGGGFREDPWGRLGRTTGYLTTITFGTTKEANRAAARVRGIHRKLRGTDPFTGEQFHLDDPHLLLWVHNCEVDSMIDVIGRSGAEFSESDAETYLREQVRAAELVGIPAVDVPVTRKALALYFEQMRPELSAIPEALESAKSLARPPMATWVKLLTPARPAWGGLAALSMASLPSWARRMYRLPGLGLTEPAATASLKALRRGLSAVPSRWRESPVTREARARAAA